MAKMSIKVDSRDFRQMVMKLKGMPDSVMQDAEDFFVAETPIRSGNARRSTKLQGTTIKADYAYAHRLDTGWSKQAPDGMTEPTINFIEREVGQQVRRIS